MQLRLSCVLGINNVSSVGSLWDVATFISCCIIISKRESYSHFGTELGGWGHQKKHPEWNSPITVNEESIGTGASYQDDPSSLCGCGQGANSVTAHLRIKSPHNSRWVHYFAQPCNGWKDPGSFLRCLRPELRSSPLSHSHSDWDPNLPTVEWNVEMFWNSSLCDCLHKSHFPQFIRQLFTFWSQLRESWHIYDALKKETSWIAVIGVEKMWKLRIHVWRQNPVIGSNNMWPWQWKTSLHLTTYALSVTAVVIPGQYALPMIYTFKHQPLSSPSWRSERKAWRH